jgi:ankyrin repeat protein
MAALEEGASPEKLRSLIKAGADVNERNKYLGQMVLMWAAVDCTNPALLRVLLEAGARVDDVDKEGSKARMLATAVNENPEVIRVLFEAGANANAVDEGGESVFGTALERSKKNKGRDEIIELLGSAGTMVHEGRTERI